MRLRIQILLKHPGYGRQVVYNSLVHGWKPVGWWSSVTKMREITLRHRPFFLQLAT
jgi:hypothetical protein